MEPFEVIASIEKDHYRTEIKAGTHTLLADEDAENGGQDAGPAPALYLATSLASCTAITLRMYADRKGWDLSGLVVRVSAAQDKVQNITKITCSLKLSGELSDTERTRLLEISNKCPVHQLLSNPIEITNTLED